MSTHGIRIILLALACNLLILKPVYSSGLVVAQSGSASSGGAQDARVRLTDLWRPGDSGERMNIRGRITGIDGTPLAGVRIHIRQADGDGDYTERYGAVIESDQQGRYQFGSVVPGNNYGPRHVHIAINHEGFGYVDTEILFKGDPNIDEATTPNAIFLEESNVKGETILFGRFDIVLTPD